MNILVISQYYFPEPFKINEICESLVQLGHSITVITGKPNYPEGKFYNGYDHLFNHEENINGVKVIRTNIKPRGTNNFSLMMNYFSFPRKAIQRLKKDKEVYDLIYVYQLSPILMVKPAIYIKRKYKTKIYLYCLDLWPESLKVLGLSENNIIFKVVKLYSKRIYDNCDKISVTSPAFIKYLHDTHKIDDSKIDYIPQHGENYFLNVKKVMQSKKLIITYAGNIGKAQDFICLINALKIVDKNCLSKLTFRIIGGGSYLADLRKLVMQYELDESFEFVNRVHKNDLLFYFNETSLFFLSLEQGNAISSTIPTKLQTYLASGRGVIGSIDGICKEIINVNKCGIMSSAGDYKELAAILNKVSRMKISQLEFFSIKSRNYFLKNFTLDKINEMIIKNMEDLLK